VELESISVEIRPRNPWEAMDLGFSMARQWWRPVYTVWFPILLPLLLVLHLVFWSRPFLALLALWWLKPLLDRILLHIYSRSVFGEQPTLRETLRAIPSMLGTGLVWHLTLLRLDPSRSFRLPVMQLEGLSGKARRARYRVLARRGNTHAQALTLICVHLESFILLGLMGLLYLLVPEAWDFNPFKVLTDDSVGSQIAFNILYLAPVSLIEPGYVAAGFALYLNRRTELEGWDIELKFRRMAERLEGLARRVAGAAAALLLTVFAALPGTPPQAAISDEPLAPTPLTAEVIPATIEAVLAHEDFERKKTYSIWLPKDTDATNDDAPARGEPWLANTLAQMAELLLWGLVAAGVILLIVYHERWLPALKGDVGRREAPPPPTVSGLDLRPESLPEDVPGTALALWRKGRPREAMSLLYRGCLSLLVNRHRLDLPESATEGDVLRLAQGHLPAQASRYLDRTTRLWQTLAYAHRLPTEADINALCEEWRPSLEAPP